MRRLLGCFPSGAIFYGGTLVWAVMSLSGFSTARREFVPDAEFLDAAIRDVTRSYPPAAPTYDDETRGYFFWQPQHAVAYESAAQFKAENKDCCTFVSRGSEGYAPSWLSHLLGDEWRIVRVRYKARFHDDSGQLRIMPAEAFVVLSRDGKVFRPR